MKKQVSFTTILLILMFSICGFAYADFEIVQPQEGAYYLNNSEILLYTNDACSDIKWYYNGDKVEPVDGNYIINLDSVDSGKTDTSVVKAVYEGETKKVKFKVYNESVIENAVNFLKASQNAEGSFGGYTGHYYIASALGDAGVDINIPKAGESTYLDYLVSLNIGEASTAGDLAKLVYALASMKKDPADFEGDNIVQFLLDKQNVDGTFGEGVYTDVLAVIALNKAEIEIPKKNELITYFEGLSYNNGLYEAWGFTDIDTTARIVRSLKILGCDTQNTIIEQAIEAINSQQTDTGAIEAWGMPNYDTTSEVVMMLLDLNIDPAEGMWNKDGKNLVTAIIENQDEDGSFKSGFDVKYSTYEELSALTGYFFKYEIPFSGGSHNSGSSSGSDIQDENPGSITISISVIGKKSSKIYPLKKIIIDETAKYGKTALQALYQTGLEFKTKYEDSYVSEIDGIKEEITSTAGWKYKVNDEVPKASAKNCSIQNGDDVVWFWAESAETDATDLEEEEEITPEPAMLLEEKQTVSQNVYVSFSDVNSEHFAWAKEEIEFLASKGIIEGAGEGKFEPGREITREEAIKIILLAIGEKAENSNETGFKDENQMNSWAVPYISWAKEIGIIKGFKDDTFKPKESITRQEMVTMIIRAISYKKLELKKSKVIQFCDWQEVPEWSRESILQAVSAGIVKGKEDGRFAGTDGCTRAEAAAMIYRLMN